MLGQLLHELHEAGRLTVGEIALCWKIESGSVYPYFQGRWPTVDKLVDLVRYCVAHGKADAANEIIATLLRGTNMVATHIPADLDANGDGRVDELDIISRCGAATAAFGKFMTDTSSAVSDGRVTENEADHADAQIDHLHIQLEAARAVYHTCAARTARRRIAVHRNAARRAAAGPADTAAASNNGRAR